MPSYKPLAILATIVARPLTVLSISLMLIVAAGCTASQPTPAPAAQDQASGLTQSVPSSVSLAKSLSAVTHSARILDLAITPDGKLLATGGSDGSAQIWEIASGEQIAQIAHDGQVNAVAFSSDGAALATASRDGTARITTIVGGQVLMQGEHGVIDASMQIPPGASYQVGDPIPAIVVQYTSDGRHLVSQGANNTLHLWDPQSGLERGLYYSSQGAPFTFSHNSAQLAFSGMYRDEAGVDRLGSMLVDLPTGAITAFLETGEVAVVGFSADDQYLVTTDAEQVQVWSISSECVVSLIDGRQAKLSADGSRLAVSTGADAVEIYGLPDLAFISKRAFPGIGHSVALSPDGAFVAAYPKTAMGDLTAIIWAVDSDTFYAAPHQQPITDMAFSPDGQLFATASTTSAIIWQIPEMGTHQLRQPAGPAAPLPCLEGEGVPGLPPPPVATPDARYTEEENTYMRLLEQNGSAILIAADEVDKWSVRLPIAPDASTDELSSWVSRLSHNLERAHLIAVPPRFSDGHAQYLAAVELIAAANRKARSLAVMVMGPEADAERASEISQALLDGSVALEQALNAMGIPFTHDEDELPPEEPLPSESMAPPSSGSPAADAGETAADGAAESVPVAPDGTLAGLVVEAAAVGGREVAVGSQEPLPGALLLSVRQTDRTWRLGVIKPGKPQVRYLNISGDVLQPALSPDGKLLAFTANEGDASFIEIYDLQSGSRQRVSPPGQASQLPSWSPDSQAVLYVATPIGGSPPDSRAFIYDRVTQMTRQLMPTRTGWAQWSSRGEIVFSTYTGRSFDLMRINSDGSGEVNLTASDDLDEDIATWSPNGEHIAFVRSPRGELQQRTIYTMRRDGSDVRTITDLGVQNSNPTWSPDGQVIAFTHSDDAESWQVWLVSLATREARPFTQNDDRVWFIQWSASAMP